MVRKNGVLMIEMQTADWVYFGQWMSYNNMRELKRETWCCNLMQFLVLLISSPPSSLSSGSTMMNCVSSDPLMVSRVSSDVAMVSWNLGQRTRQYLDCSHLTLWLN